MPNTDFEFIIFEYWDVPEQNLEQFLYWYEHIFFGSLSHSEGYAGVSICVRSKDGLSRVLGHGDGPRKAISFHPLLSQLGTQTDAMIDFDALLQNEWNVVGIQYLTSKEKLEGLFDAFRSGFDIVQPNWRDENPGMTLDEVLVKDFFSLVNNHWDVFLDAQRNLWADKKAPVVPSWSKRNG